MIIFKFSNNASAYSDQDLFKIIKKLINNNKYDTIMDFACSNHLMIEIISNQLRCGKLNSKNCKLYTKGKHHDVEIRIQDDNEKSYFIDDCQLHSAILLERCICEQDVFKDNAIFDLLDMIK